MVRPMLRQRVAVLCVCLVAVLGAGACGGTAEAVPTPVLADPVLRGAFEPLLEQNPLAPNPVVVEYGPAATVGGDVAVLATADGAAFESLAEQGRLAGEPQLFARSHLVLVTAPSNPKGVHSVTDLNRSDVVAALADADSALGDASALAFAQAKSRAPAAALRVADGAAVVDAVAGGQADAGIVEAALARSGVDTVALPEREHVDLDYKIASSTAAQAALGFIALVGSNAGREALAAAGFDLP